MSYTPLEDILLTGDPRATTPAAADNDTSVATTAFVQTELADYLLLAGGSMSGDITLGSGVDINFNDSTSGLQWSDVRLNRSAANILAMGAGDKLQQNAAPTAGDDLTNKTYVDALANGLDWKASVTLATAAALPAVTGTGTGVLTASAVGILTVDGVATVLGDNILVKNQVAGLDNGIYEVTIEGTAGVAFELTRRDDADVSAEVTSGMATYVSEGTANGGQGWVLSTVDPITLNTTALVFVQFSSASVVSAISDLSDVDTSGAVDGAILRYESSGTVWEDTATLLYSDAGQLSASTAGATGGILLGGDAQWYRASADVMRTPDALIVDGVSTLTGLVTASAGLTATTGDITASAGNIVATLGTLSIASTSTLTGLVTATGGITTATGSYTTTSTGGFTASGSGAMSTGSGNISSTSGNLVISAGTASIGGKITMSAAQKVAVSTVKTAAYTASLTADYIIQVDTATTGAFSVSLPAGHAAGDTFLIKDVVGNCGTANCTIDPDSAETIDDSATFVMTIDYQGVTVVSDGTNWFIV